MGLSTATVSLFALSPGAIILPEGITPLAVGSMDADGLAETLSTGTLKVDGTAPDVSFSLVPLSRIAGSGFGPYAGSYTRVLVGGTTAFS